MKCNPRTRCVWISLTLCLTAATCSNCCLTGVSKVLFGERDKQYLWYLDPSYFLSYISKHPGKYVSLTDRNARLDRCALRRVLHWMMKEAYQEVWSWSRQQPAKSQTERNSDCSRRRSYNPHDQRTKYQKEQHVLVELEFMNSMHCNYQQHDSTLFPVDQTWLHLLFDREPDLFETTRFRPLQHLGIRSVYLP